MFMEDFEGNQWRYIFLVCLFFIVVRDVPLIIYLLPFVKPGEHDNTSN